MSCDVQAWFRKHDGLALCREGDISETRTRHLTSVIILKGDDNGLGSGGPGHCEQWLGWVLIRVKLFTHTVVSSLSGRELSMAFTLKHE